MTRKKLADISTKNSDKSLNRLNEAFQLLKYSFTLFKISKSSIEGILLGELTDHDTIIRKPRIRAQFNRSRSA